MSDVVIEYKENGYDWVMVSDYSSMALLGDQNFSLKFNLEPPGNFFSIEFSTPDYIDTVNTQVQAVLTAYDESDKKLSHFEGPIFAGPGKHSITVNLNFSTACLAYVICKTKGAESGLMYCSNLNTDNNPLSTPIAPTNFQVDIKS